MGLKCSLCHPQDTNTGIVRMDAKPDTWRTEHTVGIDWGKTKYNEDKIEEQWYCKKCDAWWGYYEKAAKDPNRNHCVDCGSFMKRVTGALAFLEWMQTGWWP